MKIKVTADSTCDLSPELCRQYDITMAPLSVVIDGQSFHDGVDVTPQDIFRAVGAGKTVKTTAVNQYEYEKIFRTQLETYDAVIHLTISRDMSSCYADACRAAEKVGHVHVVDSRNLSTGTGLLVLEAAEMAGEGMEPEAIAQKLRERVDKVCASFTVQDIGYLYRGGRCSGLEAMGARLLKIRPSIEVHSGKMSAGKKYRGSYELYLDHYIRDMLSDSEHIDDRRIFITHSPCDDGMTDYARKAVMKYGSFQEILDTDRKSVV